MSNRVALPAGSKWRCPVVTINFRSRQRMKSIGILLLVAPMRRWAGVDRRAGRSGGRPVARWIAAPGRGGGEPGVFSQEACPKSASRSSRRARGGGEQSRRPSAFSMASFSASSNRTIRSSSSTSRHAPELPAWHSPAGHVQRRGDSRCSLLSPRAIETRQRPTRRWHADRSWRCSPAPGRRRMTGLQRGGRNASAGARSRR